MKGCGKEYQIVHIYSIIELYPLSDQPKLQLIPRVYKNHTIHELLFTHKILILYSIGAIGSCFKLKLLSCWKLMKELPLQVEAISVEIPMSCEEIQNRKDVVMGTKKGQAIYCEERTF